MTGPARVPAPSNRSLVARFLSIPTTTGRTESVAGDQGRVPTDEEFARLSGELARAAATDPLPFHLTDSLRDAATLATVLQGAGDRLRAHGLEAELDEPQQRALEAIVRLTGRPALLVQDDWIELPTGPWEMLAPYRDAIARAVACVGRLGIADGYGLPYAGTGFMVGAGLVMTNRHVVEPFAMQRGRGWLLDPGCNMTFDTKEEFGSTSTRCYAVASIRSIDDREDVDLALLQLAAPLAGAPPWPSPLAVQGDTKHLAAGNTVYVVGYPAADSDRNDDAVMQQIMHGVYGKKRLSPGRVTEADPHDFWFNHDCTTLGGNSGSCVVDLTTNAVIGLHFAGEFGVSNSAVSLPPLRDDPALRDVSWRSGRDE